MKNIYNFNYNNIYSNLQNRVCIYYSVNCTLDSIYCPIYTISIIECPIPLISKTIIFYYDSKAGTYHVYLIRNRNMIPSRFTEKYVPCNGVWKQEISCKLFYLVLM